ncbi:MAG: hypothetical protein HYZ91_00065 [Candidatus Omnitrophica bacterium]|nr:hypothetical protein [Candidatus Omnitrophota bacterium]
MRGRRLSVAGAVMAALIGFMSMSRGVAQATSKTDAADVWDFETERVNAAPRGFAFSRTGNGRLGRWVVWPVKDAPSGTHILAQVDSDDIDFRFPMALADTTPVADVRVGVKCKPVSGVVDQSCGLVVRYQDEANYYVARANALEQNVRFYKVVSGHRQQLGSWRGAVATGVWHELQLEARGDQFTVRWDGQGAITLRDQTFRQPGRIGVWTKADTVAYFDELRLEPIAP